MRNFGVRWAAVALVGTLVAVGGMGRASLSFGQAGAAQPKDAEAQFESAKASLAKGELDAAITGFRRTIELRPDFAAAHHSLGAALRKKDDLDGAIRSFQKAVGLKADLSVAHADLADALLAKSQVAPAITHLRRVIQLQPEAGIPHYRLGLAQEQMGTVDDAIASYREAIKLQPKLADAYFALGKALRAKASTPQPVAQQAPQPDLFVIEGQPAMAPARVVRSTRAQLLAALDEVIANYRLGVERAPESVDGHFLLASALIEKGLPDEAIASFRRVIELDPKRDDAYVALGTALEGKGEFNEAIEVFTKALENNPRGATERIRLAKALAAAGKYADANDIVKQLTPEDFRVNARPAREVLDTLVNWTGGEHRWEQTESYLTTLVYGSEAGGYLDRTFVQNTIFELMYAPLLLELGRTDRYESLRDSALSRHGNTRNTMYAERTLMVSLLKPPDELQMSVISKLAEVVAQINPENPDQHMLRWAFTVVALSHYRQGNYEQTLEWGKKCIDLGEHPAVTQRAQVVMAMAHLRLNQLDQAKAELDKCRARIEKMNDGIELGTEYESAGFWHGNAKDAGSKIYNEKGFWHDWVMNKLLLREALTLMDEKVAQK